MMTPHPINAGDFPLGKTSYQGLGGELEVVNEPNPYDQHRRGQCWFDAQILTHLAKNTTYCTGTRGGP